MLSLHSLLVFFSLSWVKTIFLAGFLLLKEALPQAQELALIQISFHLEFNRSSIEYADFSLPLSTQVAHHVLKFKLALIHLYFILRNLRNQHMLCISNFRQGTECMVLELTRAFFFLTLLLLLRKIVDRYVRNTAAIKHFKLY